VRQYTINTTVTRQQSQAPRQKAKRRYVGSKDTVQTSSKKVVARTGTSFKQKQEK
jgi:hypothetical protein